MPPLWYEHSRKAPPAVTSHKGTEEQAPSAHRGNMADATLRLTPLRDLVNEPDCLMDKKRHFHRTG